MAWSKHALTEFLVDNISRTLQSGVSEVEQFLTRQGLNSQSILEGTKGVTSKAEEAINYASPTVKSTAGTLSATNPQLLAKYALGLAALYYLVRP